MASMLSYIKYFENIPTINRGICNLDELVDILNYGHKCSVYNFETNYIKLFPENFYLDEDFMPKFIIERFMEIHRFHRYAIEEKFIPREVINYDYRCKGILCYYEFNNDMDLHDDILILLFLHVALATNTVFNETVQELLGILHDKYIVNEAWCIGKLRGRTLMNRNKFKLLYYTMLSFPSVTICVYRQSLRYIAATTLVDTVRNVPNAIYHFMILKLLPHSAIGGPPKALLVFIIKKYMRSRDSTIRWRTALDYFKTFYHNDIFPEEMKVQLCKCWNIVEEDGYRIFFNPAIVKLNRQVKRMLTEKARTNKDLRGILYRL